MFEITRLPGHAARDGPAAPREPIWIDQTRFVSIAHRGRPNRAMR